MPVNAYMLFLAEIILEAFVLYYVMGMSVPSLYRESTNSLIKTILRVPIIIPGIAEVM